ncbi:MAG: helix-turn-helix domain-containing protein [Actinomycetota bacterium]|nr:helix-turn-helix domain-containing protein [Actinomycetota bacterium]
MPPGKTDPQTGRDSTTGVAEALADPLRAEVFDELAGWLGTATVAELSELVGAAVDEVARHLAVLERCDLVEPVTTAGATGDVAYRATREPLVRDEAWTELPPAVRRQLLTRKLEKIEQRIWAAVARGGFDRPEAQVSWLPAELDERGAAEMSALMAETLERALDVQGRSVQRRADGATEGTEVKTDLMLLHFRRESGRATPPGVGSTGPVRERLYSLSDAIAATLPAGTPDWPALAAVARELAAIAERCAADEPAE